MNPKDRILELSSQLTEANYRYYVLDDPTMPDLSMTISYESWKNWKQPIRNSPLLTLPPNGWVVKH